MAYFQRPVAVAADSAWLSVAAAAVRLRQVHRAARELEGGHLERLQGEGVCGALPFNKQQTTKHIDNVG